MSLTYATLTTSLANLIAIQSSDSNFQGILPEIIDYAELRIQRDLDLLNTVTADNSTITTAGSRNVTIPNTFVTVQQINALTPAGATATSGTRIALTPVAKEYMDAVYNTPSVTGIPVTFAMLSQFNVILGPYPNDTYTLEVVGTQRVTPLSATNSTNFLSTYLPDLYLAAAMIFTSGWMRNFGSQSDNPQMSVSWEGQYGNLLKSATVEEFRKKFQASAWSSMSPPAVASPTR